MIYKHPTFSGMQTKNKIHLFEFLFFDNSLDKKFPDHNFDHIAFKPKFIADVGSL